MKSFFRVLLGLCATVFFVPCVEAGIYSNDFSVGVGAATNGGSAVVTGGQNRFTVFGTMSQYGTLLLNDLDPGVKIKSFIATFNLAIDGHGTGGADGFSFNFANPATYPTGYQSYEVGAGTNGLNVRFATYTGQYCALGVNGIGPVFFAYGNIGDGTNHPVTITYNKSIGASLTYRAQTLNIAATQLTALGFSGPQTGYKFFLAARNGGGTEDVYVDNLVVTTVPSGSNAALANLSLSAGALSPVFNASTTNYAVSVPLLTTSIAITPTAADSNATITVNGTNVASGAASGSLAVNGGTNTYAVAVTAEDGTTIRNYSITVALPGRHFVAPGSLSPVAPYANWQNAAHTIQEAIDVSSAGDYVLVSNGVYSTGGRVVHEAITNRVAITNAITVQSVNGPDVTTIEGVATPGDAAVRCVYVGENAALSGFTLTSGATRYDGYYFTEQNGGGIWSESSGVISNCVLIFNTAMNVGGGVAGGILYNCVLVNNVAVGGGGAYLATLSNCTINDNTATYAGGGIWNCTLNRCMVSGNQGYNYGAGSFCDPAGSSVLNNCVVKNNYAGLAGGGDYQGVLNNSVVWGNSAPQGGGVEYSTVNNSIVFNNGGNPGFENHDSSVFAYSCTSPDPGGIGNITDDPLFVAPFDSPPDFHLTAASPCINGGDNASIVGSTDLDGRPRIANGAVDMGAFEAQAIMRVLGTNGIVIANGDLSPALADGTDFGLAPAPTGSVTRTFAITNSGDSDLVISGVTIGGTNAVEFSVQSFPSTVSAGTQSDLVVLFAPVSGGAKSATIMMDNNDAINSNYVFAVQGSSDLPVPAIRVLGINGSAITNGDTTANAADGTDFGFAYAPTGIVTRTFAITNAGLAPLVISGISTSGPNAADFSVLSFPAIVSAGAQSNFVVRFSPSATGAKSATISVFNNDLTNLTYAFSVAGTSYAAQVRYVWTNSPSPAAPYLTWSNAAHTIQDAVDAAIDTDLILVTNGIYTVGGRVMFGAMTNRVAINKAVMVLSVNGPAVTTIQGVPVNGNTAVRCVYVGTNAVLSGFTLTNGATRITGDLINEQNGGGASVESSGVISNCVISGNTAFNLAGGVYGGIVNRCIVSGNSAFGGGGAGFGTMNNCLLFGNVASGNNGGAVWGAILNNCTLSGNSAVIQAGGAYVSSLTNCIVYFNSAPTGPNYSGGTFAYTCTTPAPGGTGNITNLPLFAATNDFHLRVDSPCIDAGNAGVVGTTDLDGNPRILSVTVDMGTYETPVPAIAVIGINGALITNGLAVPNLADGTDYFWCNLTNATITRTFSITNSGTGPLIISGVTANGTGASDFTVLVFPAVVPVGGVSNLVIRFDPSVLGIRTAVVAIANNGRAAVSNYTFVIQGVGNSPATRYVATNSPSPTLPYTNWQTAAHTIQDAVDLTFAGDHVIVTNGIYSAGGRPLPLYTVMTNRVVITNAITIESVNGPAVTTIQGAKDPITINGPAAVRCVYISSTNAVLSGFTIAGGATQTNLDIYGGGVYALDNSVLLMNCMITGNTARQGAGGVWFGTLNNCTITSNSVPTGGGGGTFNSILNYCLIAGNNAQQGGGASFSTLNNCIIYGNTATNTGGGADLGTLNNCVIYGNKAIFGGGAYNDNVNNCTIVSNSATYGGGVLNGIVRNSIIYYNTASAAGPNYHTFVTMIIDYSCTAPLPGGTGNFTNQPLFVATNDYHLTAGSPCRDAGFNAYAPSPVDFDGSNRIVNIGVDVGAYEFQSGAPVDYDGDGMPSWWEAGNGLSAATSNAITANADSDWMTDLEEYFADTIPTDVNSYFPPVTVTGAMQNILNIHINPTSTGRVYGIFANTNLLQSPQAWVLIPPEKTGTASTITFIATNALPNGSYRTGVRLP